LPRPFFFSNHILFSLCFAMTINSDGQQQNFLPTTEPTHKTKGATTKQREQPQSIFFSKWGSPSLCINHSPYTPSLGKYHFITPSDGITFQ
jgi:hypothetical protein